MSDTMIGTSLEEGESAAPAQEFGGEQEQPPEQAAAPAAEAPAPTEDDDKAIEDQAIEIPTGKVVPLSALLETRQTVKDLKKQLADLEPASAEAAQLRQYLHEAKPYIEFLKNNPQLLTPQAQPQRQPEPTDDIEAVDYAKEFDLYTADGKPDVTRARRIIEKQTKIALAAAQQATAPIAHQTESNKVSTVLQALSQEKDGEGNPVNPAAINAVAQDLVQKLGQAGARRFLATDESYDLVANMVWGKHAKMPRKKMPAAPEHPPLETERAGGGSGEIVIDSRRLHALGMTEKAYKETAKGFKPNSYNELE